VLYLPTHADVRYCAVPDAVYSAFTQSREMRVMRYVVTATWTTTEAGSADVEALKGDFLIP
jgi:hypothetical protein